jgi:hypothetical protein
MTMTQQHMRVGRWCALVSLVLSYRLLLVRGFLPLTNVDSKLQYTINTQQQSAEGSSSKYSQLFGSLSPEPVPEVAQASAALVCSQLSPLEGWCARELEDGYQRAVSVKCPFLKRRMVDALDAVDMIMRFLVIRHKSLDIFGPPPGHRSKFQQCIKNKHQTTTELLEIIRQDWKVDTHSGYYITGKLNATIYRDDCLFNGPDPDMPVR